MKITIDKNLTAVNRVKATREAANAFKNTFTENDLVRMFNEEFDKFVSGEVLKCNLEAFPTGIWSNDYSFRVELVVFDFIGFHAISYYINYDGVEYAINHDPILVTHNIYSKDTTK